MAKVLIGYSRCNLTREAFERHGHDTWTADKLPSRDGHEKHLTGDIHDHLYKDWDFAILHPMCTYLTVSAAWAFKDPNFDKYPNGGYHQKLKPETLTGQARRDAREIELHNFKGLLRRPYPVVIENPGLSFINTSIRPPDQKIQPYEFGDDASKNTGLWRSKGVPELRGTNRIQGRMVIHNGKAVERWANQTDSGQNNLTPGDGRWLQRSETYPGIAEAFGDQWGKWLNERR